MKLSFFAHSEVLAPFFLLVGVQLRAEITHMREILLPTIAAIGGMIFPVFIFLTLNRGSEISSGWPLVMPTDIALVMAVLLVLGKRVPPSLKTFMLAIAVADDLLSIFVIGVKYSGSLHPTQLMSSIGAVAIGAVLWRAPFQKSLNRIVNFVILPLYIFANIYPAITENFDISSKVGSSIAISRIVGKLLGIVFFTWIAVRMKVAALPPNLSFGQLTGGALLAGMGLAVSLLIANVAFQDEILLNQIRTGLLEGALLSAIFGAVVLWLVSSRSAPSGR